VAKRKKGLGELIPRDVLKRLDLNPSLERATEGPGGPRAPRLTPSEKRGGKCRTAYKHKRYYTSCRAKLDTYNWPTNRETSFDLTIADGPPTARFDRNVLGMGLFRVFNNGTGVRVMSSSVMAETENVERELQEHGARLACSLKVPMHGMTVQKSPWWKAELKRGRAKCTFFLKGKGGEPFCSIAQLDPCVGKPRKPAPHEPGYEMRPEIKARAKCRVAKKGDRYRMHVCNQRRYGYGWRGFDVKVEDTRTGKVVGKGLFKNAGNGYLVETEGVKAATPEIELDINLFAARFACNQKSHFASDPHPERSSFWRLHALDARPTSDEWRQDAFTPEQRRAGARPVYLTPEQACKGPYVFDPSGVLQRRRR
jgi:hypothetical protein